MVEPEPLGLGQPGVLRIGIWHVERSRHEGRGIEEIDHAPLAQPGSVLGDGHPDTVPVVGKLREQRQALRAEEHGGTYGVGEWRHAE